MDSRPDAASRPGLRQGSTNEFTLLFHVKPGHGQQIREFFAAATGRGTRDVAIESVGTLHDARWVLFDDDTRLLFATNFDGDWDTYIEDVAAAVGQLFDSVLQHTENYPGIRDPRVNDYVVAHQHAAQSYYRAYPGATVKDIRKALAVQNAFQQLLDETSG